MSKPQRSSDGPAKTESATGHPKAAVPGDKSREATLTCASRHTHAVFKPTTSRDRVFIAISLCGHRRTNTARRRGVPLAPTAPASAKTNRAVRVGHAVSSESKRTAILRTGFVTLTRQQNHTKPHIYLPPLPNRRAPPPFARRAAPPFYFRSLLAMSSSSSSSSSPSPSRSASSATSASASAPRHAGVDLRNFPGLTQG